MSFVMMGTMDNSGFSLSEDKKYFNSALEKWNAGDYADALGDCNKALAINSLHGQSIRLKGMLHYALEQLQEARESYLKTIELDDACLEDFFDLGKIENSLGDHESASIHLLRSIEINIKQSQDSADAFNWDIFGRSSYLLSNSLLNQGQYISGINVYENWSQSWDWSIKKYSNFNAEFLRIAACLYSDNNDSEKAKATIDRAKALDPSSAEIWYDSGVIKRNAGDFHGAIKDFEESHKINPSFNSAIHNIGSIYFDLGSKENACKCWQIGADLGNENSQELLKRHCSDE